MQLQLCSASGSFENESIFRLFVQVVLHSSIDEYFAQLFLPLRVVLCSRYAGAGATVVFDGGAGGASATFSRRVTLRSTVIGSAGAAAATAAAATFASMCGAAGLTTATTLPPTLPTFAPNDLTLLDSDGG